MCVRMFLRLLKWLTAPLQLVDRLLATHRPAPPWSLGRWPMFPWPSSLLRVRVLSPLWSRRRTPPIRPVRSLFSPPVYFFTMLPFFSDSYFLFSFRLMLQLISIYARLLTIFLPFSQTSSPRGVRRYRALRRSWLGQRPHRMRRSKPVTLPKATWTSFLSSLSRRALPP